MSDAYRLMTYAEMATALGMTLDWRRTSPGASDGAVSGAMMVSPASASPKRFSCGIPPLRGRAVPRLTP